MGAQYLYEELASSSALFWLYMPRWGGALVPPVWLGSALLCVSAAAEPGLTGMFADSPAHQREVPDMFFINLRQVVANLLSELSHAEIQSRIKDLLVEPTDNHLRVGARPYNEWETDYMNFPGLFPLRQSLLF